MRCYRRSVNNLTPLDFRCVPFRRKAVRAYSSGGTPYFRWVPFGMPQLGNYKWTLDMVFFLYPTEGDALVGTKHRFPRGSAIASVAGVCGYHQRTADVTLSPGEVTAIRAFEVISARGK